MQIKLLIVHNKYKSKHIGGEDVVYEQEKRLLQNKIGKENIFSYEVSNDNLTPFNLFFSIWFSYKHYKNIHNIVKNNNIKIVHVHNFFPLLTPSIFIGAKKAGAVVIHTLHNYRLWCISGILYREGNGICETCPKKPISFAGIFHKCYRNSAIQSLWAQLAFWFYKAIKIFNYIDYYFVLTHFEEEKVNSFGIKKEKLIYKPNCIQTMTERKKETTGYIYVGRLEESKGIFKLLEIWETLDKRFILTVIGTGEQENYLRKKYQKKNILFKGKCSRKQTLEYISQSKFLIHPSLLYETFGLTMIEAMNLAIPVIGLNIGTRSEIIQHEYNGFLCTINNLKNTIIQSYDTNKYEYLRKNAYHTSLLYTPNYIINKQVNIYQSVIKKHISYK